MSTHRRFFAQDIDYPKSSVVILCGEEFTHAKTVLRVKTGDEITLLDGSGKEFSAIVEKVEKTQLSAHITGVIEGDREPVSQFYLLCGALKGDKTELVVQKATELGATKIGVFSSEFCSAYLSDNKLLRLEKVAREAAKQCMRSKAPEVCGFPDLKSALSSAEGYAHKLFACEFLKQSEISFSSVSGSVAVAVGSEGGFSESEFALAQEMGFKGISLGKRILRAETAAITVCALAEYFLGELK